MDERDTSTVTTSRGQAKPKVERPRLHKVMLVNDDFTPREFVVMVLKAEFRMGEERASQVMRTAHQRGSCGGRCVHEGRRAEQGHERHRRGAQARLPSAVHHRARGSSRGRRRKQEQEVFFSEEKEAKRLSRWVPFSSSGRDSWGQGFLVLFFKKELACLPCFCGPAPRPAPSAGHGGRLLLGHAHGSFAAHRRAARGQDRLRPRWWRAQPREGWLAEVAEDIAYARARGTQVIVVSSGAIALARGTLGLGGRRLRLEEKQAAAAVGQIRLAQAWAGALGARGMVAAQLLLTLGDTEDRRALPQRARDAAHAAGAGAACR